MPSLIVYRGQGDREGEPLVEPLAATIPVLYQRGRREIDYRSTDAVEMTVEVPYSEAYHLGELVTVTEYYRGYKFIGKITGIDHALDLRTQITTLQLRGATHE